ncbi:penicillin-binding protein [Mucilaginibacter phyllosphaerae]|uniref:Cell division protein FtsI (Penicillin-binding protein 3) n=1 Tax=Mucilaginibacter phyllosphaerae TaxID=1812349 RepID=A0A4Y8AI73_9SPHI|nr:penicillin-binding protein [Mucilaginibacter phyllosphaerae]MBB3968516.1 cell division protein FtsI (penicillin-binding protein 3) [Mucilaginibacter phyllosphaerae]TEW67841.1 PASTA domain-containing protein [Mucilaginibacter phyllosphaerae]GGH15533.1 penicillin-binding protein [Mucilaginibacter phyllosphaerae]
MSIRTNILLRVYLAFGLILLFAAAVVFQLCRVQFVQGKKWQNMSKVQSTRYKNIEAARGNIFSVDGSLLATSVPEYELRMDMLAGGIENDKVFNEKIDSLAMKMSAYFGDKSAREYTRIFRDARKDSSRYQLVRRKVTYHELKDIRKFPIFNMGKYKGGLIVVQQNKRILPFRSLAARTIGYKNDNVKNAVGLEGAYASYINGESGKRLERRMAGGVWMPINDDDEIAPKEGADIMSTIDVNFQDVAQTALEKQLIYTKADHGAVILMEVATGEVRAVANYTRMPDGSFKEKFNYAIAGNQDPGSTFKLASYMALLEDHKVDTGTMVNTGEYPIPGHTIKDSHGSIGRVSVKKAFEKSSNAAVAYLINTSYKDNQSKFTDHLYDWHLNEKMGLQIPGEAQPVVKNPNNKSWNKNMTLPQMAYGYEMQLTPLKMLSFYNAVANGGKMVTPVFVREIRRLGNTVERFHTRTLNEKICSDVTLKKMQEMLEGVVNEGSGKEYVYSPLFKIAGKTGTAQVADANKGYKAKKQYQASFCGYFPADKPKYSLIVVINDPKNGYYAASVAGPVFREIADKVYASDMEVNQTPAHLIGNTTLPKFKQGNLKALKKVYEKLGVKPLYASATPTGLDTSNGIASEDNKYKTGTVPNVTGMGLSDALYALGNAGYKVAVKGSGSVTTQSVTGGSMIPKGSKITIELQ